MGETHITEKAVTTYTEVGVKIKERIMTSSVESKWELFKRYSTIVIRNQSSHASRCQYQADYFAYPLQIFCRRIEDAI
jgi:hypothetical protein